MKYSKKKKKDFFLFVLQYGDTTHTLIERGDYAGLFLPNYQEHPLKNKDRLLETL